MIIREIQSYRVIDATTNTTTPRPLDYRLILAPLLYWRIELTERRLTLIEPQSGSLGSPDPNAFMVVVPPSYAMGRIFGIQLLDTDWESEGFAVGDTLDMAMGLITTNSVFLRATIQGISGQTAMFVINMPYNTVGTLDTQNPFPLVAFLANERLNIKAALLRDGDFGFTSPLNGQPFYVSGHANSLNITPASITNSILRYNLRLYNGTQEGVIDSLMPNARNLKNVYIEIGGTQFYAYRSSLDPTANTPTQAYPTRGKIVIDAEAPNELRNLSFEADCLLLHPNRIEETNNFVTPGTLTITGTISSISAPAIPSPVKELVCLLGPDSHHSLPSVFSSLDLTAEIAPPSLPPSRQGADYVGVVVGQVGGKWVAAMTNKEPASPPVIGPFRVLPHRGPIYRYDSLWGILLYQDLPAGIYIIQTMLKVNNSFVLIDEVEYNTTDIVTTPYPPTHHFTARTNIYPLSPRTQTIRAWNVYNYDLFISPGDQYFYIPVPSRRTPPNIPSALIQPSGGYGLDLNNWASGAITLKWRLFVPNGNVYDSNELTFPSIDEPSGEIIRFEPDNQLATISETAAEIIAEKASALDPETQTYHTYIRAAVFERPEGYKPVIQTMFYVEEDYSVLTVLNSHSEGHSDLIIDRQPFNISEYTITLNKTGLPPGQYTLHVRSSIRKKIDFFAWQLVEDESYFYDFTIPAPPEPPAGPPLAPDFCVPKIPAVAGESWEWLYRDENGDWIAFIAAITGCELPNYCGCFEVTSIVPDTYIDIIGYFRGAIHGKVVPDGTKHKARFRGRIIRLADEYTTEDFVSSSYKAEDIVRAYAPKYQIELFLQTPCDLANLDLLKFAWKWDVTNRSNKLLPSLIRDLKPGELDISDSGTHVRATITLKTLTWRDEYRRQG